MYAFGALGELRYRATNLDASLNFNTEPVWTLPLTARAHLLTTALILGLDMRP